MRKLTFNLAAILSLALIIVSCDEPADSEPNKGEVKAEEKIEFDPEGSKELTERRETTKKIFHALPSPVEMADLIKKSGATFDHTILNSPDNADSYLTAFSKAINLGIYGADLSYTGIYEQDKQSRNYLGVVQDIANALDVGAAIDKGVIDRLKDNRENQDSIMNIITDTYWNINAYLKENEGNAETSALVIAGGWLEGLYLAGKHYDSENGKLRDRIAEQKYTLKNLCDLMDTYDSDNLTEFKADLAEVKALYDEVEITKGKTTSEEDASGTMVIGGERKISMKDETLEAVLSKIEELRNKYI